MQMPILSCGCRCPINLLSYVQYLQSSAGICETVAGYFFTLSHRPLKQYFSVHLRKYFNQAQFADFVWSCWFWERRQWGRRWISREPSEKKSSFSLVNDSGKKIKRKAMNKKAKHKNEGIDWMESQCSFSLIKVYLHWRMKIVIDIISQSVLEYYWHYSLKSVTFVKGF